MSIYVIAWRVFDLLDGSSANYTSEDEARRYYLELANQGYPVKLLGLPSDESAPILLDSANHKAPSLSKRLARHIAETPTDSIAYVTRARNGTWSMAMKITLGTNGSSTSSTLKSYEQATDSDLCALRDMGIPVFDFKDLEEDYFQREFAAMRRLHKAVCYAPRKIGSAS